MADLAKLVYGPAAFGAMPSALRQLERLLRPLRGGSDRKAITGPIMGNSSMASVGANSTQDVRSSVITVVIVNIVRLDTLR